MNTKTTTKPASRLPVGNGEKQAPSRIEKIKCVQLEVKQLQLTIRGTSPLVVHAWSEKAKTQMLGKQTGKASSGKEPKDPVADFKSSLYRLPDGSGFAIPAISLKSAAVRASNDVELKMVEMRRAFHINADLVRIDAPPVTEPFTPEDIEYADRIAFEHKHGASMRQDCVRLNGGTADIRFRGWFPQWSITFVVRYNSRVISAEQLINLFNCAGFGVGLCEHRAEKGGSWGLFEVA